MSEVNLSVGIFVFLGVVAAVLFQPEAKPADPWFQSSVIENSRPVVVKFGADWCPPCRSMDAALSKVKRSFPQARFVTINIDEKPDVFRAYRSGSGIPQVAIFKNGSVVSRTRGFGGDAALRSWLNESL